MTEACGSGASAAAWATHRWGLTGDTVTVRQPGGDVMVSLTADAVVAHRRRPTTSPRSTFRTDVSSDDADLTEPEARFEPVARYLVGSSHRPRSMRSIRAVVGWRSQRMRSTMRPIAGAFGEFGGEIRRGFLDRAFRERIVVVGMAHSGMDLPTAEASLDELELLVDTAGADAVARIIQRRDRPDRATFVGKGKVQEILDVALELDADTVVVR